MSSSNPAGPGRPASGHEDHPETISRNSRYGLILFAVYCVLYGGFIFLSAFAPQRMSEKIIGGVNVAVAYGVGLILSALALAVVYMFLCRSGGRSRDAGSSEIPDVEGPEIQA